MCELERLTTGTVVQYYLMIHATMKIISNSPTLPVVKKYITDGKRTGAEGRGGGREVEKLINLF